MAEARIQTHNITWNSFDNLFLTLNNFHQI